MIQVSNPSQDMAYNAAEVSKPFSFFAKFSSVLAGMLCRELKINAKSTPSERDCAQPVTPAIPPLCTFNTLPPRPHTACRWINSTSADAVAHNPPLPSIASVTHPSPPWQKAVSLFFVGSAAGTIHWDHRTKLHWRISDFAMYVLVALL